jgi:hypothetical protein
VQKLVVYFTVGNAGNFHASGYWPLKMMAIAIT